MAGVAAPPLSKTRTMNSKDRVPASIDPDDIGYNDTPNEHFSAVLEPVSYTHLTLPTIYSV